MQFKSRPPLFDKLPQRDEITWTTLISRYLNSADTSEPLSLFSTMWLDPSQRMDPFLLSLALKACAASYSAKLGQSIHGYCVKTDFVSSVFVGNALLDMYMKTGKVYEGCRVFDEMPIRNVVSWTAIITGLVRAGFNMEGISYFAKLCGNNMSYDSYTLAVALKACADARLIQTGKEIHARCICAGLDHTAMVRSSLINMYSKCGSIKEALKIFNDSKHNDIVVWTAMINGYAEHGLSQKAIDLFELLIETVSKPGPGYNGL